MAILRRGGLRLRQFSRRLTNLILNQLQWQMIITSCRWHLCFTRVNNALEEPLLLRLQWTFGTIKLQRCCLTMWTFKMTFFEHLMVSNIASLITTLSWPQFKASLLKHFGVRTSSKFVAQLTLHTL